MSARASGRSGRKPHQQTVAAAVAVAPALASARQIRIACTLGLACFAIYLSSLRQPPVWDSIPSRLLPFTILREGNLDFDEFRWLFQVDEHPYFLHQTRSGNHMSTYSVVGGVLATPLSIPAVWWAQYHGIADDDVRFRLLTVAMERIGAASFAALSVALVFVGLCQLTSTGRAVAVTLVYGLGTSLWTIGSQALLQHGLVAMALAAANVFLLGADSRRNAIAASLCVALAVLARPTMLVFALAAVLFMWRERLRHLWAFLFIPAAGATVLLAYNASVGHLIRGGYGKLQFVWPRPWSFAGLLISPNRGLLVYTPAAILAFAMVRYGSKERAPWLFYLLGAIVAYLLFYSAWHGWHGGNCYGPRFLTDALPAMALCSVPAVERLWRVGAGRVVLVGLAAWGVVVQALGVYWDDNSWNDREKQQLYQRVWDWSDPQILRAARSGWHGTELAQLLWQTLTDPRPVLLKRLDGTDLTGELTLAEASPGPFRANTKERLDVRITNHSGAVWPVFSDYGYLQCALTYRWWQGSSMLDIAGGIQLPRNVHPGESVDVRGLIETPPAPGHYELELMMVQLLGAARGRIGTVRARLPIEVL